jgi:alanyl-tRNA synthetase
MLGNFSFGDYFKKEAIPFAWELLTGVWRLEADRLFPTVFNGESGIPRDDEAFDIWTTLVPAGRITELGLAENFWSMGETGPCGRCSEIHYFRGNQVPCDEERQGGACRGIDCSCDRYVEVWNNVFMEFDRQPGGALNPLPAPSIDTGMGLERITAVIQGKLSNYDTDLFTPILGAIGEQAGRPYGASLDDPTDVSMRVIADHLRAMTFLIADGVVPSNEWRGYVLRKIMRRAMRHGAAQVRGCRRAGDERRLPGARLRPRRHRACGPQRGRALRCGAHCGAAAARGRARSGGGGQQGRSRRRSVQALRLARRPARFHGGSRRPAPARYRP